MIYRWTVCDPLNEKVIDKGELNVSDIERTFREYPWVDELNKTKREGAKVYYSPSLEVIEPDGKSALTFSAVESGNGFVFYVFYKRPELTKKLFGLYSSVDSNYVTDVMDVSFDESVEMLNMFIDRKKDGLRRIFG